MKKTDAEGLKSSPVNFVIYIPGRKNTTFCNAPHVNSTMKTPQGKDHYTVYINYLKDAFDTNVVQTLETYAVVNGLALETDLFASDELNKLHDFFAEVMSKKQTKPQRQSPMDLKDRTNLI